MAAKKDASSAAQFRAMEEKLKTKKPSGKKPADSLVTSNKKGTQYPIYQIDKDGLLQPVTDTNGRKRLSFILSGNKYSETVQKIDKARQNEALKIIDEQGKEKIVPSITLFLLYEKGITETPLGNGVFLQLPREAISDVHWDEFAEPLTSPDEFEAFRRSSQRASKKEPLDVYGKKQSETMQVSTNKSKSFGDMLKSKLTRGM
jgi:hypothetical protein